MMAKKDIDRMREQLKEQRHFIVEKLAEQKKEYTKEIRKTQYYVGGLTVFVILVLFIV